MKVIILAAAVAVALGYVSAIVLSDEQEPAYKVFVGSGARVGDQPGTNLVGPDWDGLNRPARQG